MLVSPGLMVGTNVNVFLSFSSSEANVDFVVDFEVAVHRFGYKYFVPKSSQRLNKNIMLVY